jgi:hypothetical protein
LLSVLFLILGVGLSWFFLFGYGTTQNGVHNIGMLTERICGLLAGISFVTWSLIVNSRG